MEDKGFVRKVVTRLESTLKANLELRDKFAEEPTQFLSSDFDLNEVVRTFSAIPEAQCLSEFAKSKGPELFVSMISHENAEIVSTMLSVLSELLAGDSSQTEARHELGDRLVELDLIGLLDGLFETPIDGTSYSVVEAERDLAVFRVLENFAELEPKLYTGILSRTHLSAFLAAQISRDSVQTEHRQLRMYATELLFDLTLYAEREAVLEFVKRHPDLCEEVLRQISAFQSVELKKDTEDREFAFNLLNLLLVISESDFGKELFLQAEGLELMLIILRSSPSRPFRAKALRLIEQAVHGLSGGRCAHRLVNEAGGIGTLFGYFMRIPYNKGDMDRDLASLISIFASLMRWLAVDSDERLRVLVKFEENDLEKSRKLVRIRKPLQKRLRKLKAQYDEDQSLRNSDDKSTDNSKETDLYLELVQSGLGTLQDTDTIFAWLVIEQPTMKGPVSELLESSGQSLHEIKQTLSSWSQSIEKREDKDSEEAENDLEIKEMLDTITPLLDD